MSNLLRAIVGLMLFSFLIAPGRALAIEDELTAADRTALMERFGVSAERLDTILKIIDEGKNRNQTFQHLTYLCEQIGPRLTGSSRLETANNWVAEQFKSFGMTNVRLHEWGQLPVRFDRGPSSGSMVEPAERPFEFTTRSWSAGTDGPRRGPVLREPQTEEELTAISEKLSGAWILRPAGSDPSAFVQRLNFAGIAGFISSSQDELVRTGGVSGITKLDPENLSPEVTVIVRRSDYDAINSRLFDKQEVVVEFDLKHEFTPGPIPVYNTIGEITGTEFPDEVVIISAHLDSWDGPGSQGTVDNGTGSCVTIEAARILCACGIKPKRTIRFILWSGEEQGLLGSQAYVASLSEAERAKISAVFVDDSGTNQQSSLTCAESMAKMLQQAIEPMNYAFADAPIKLNIQPLMPSRGGASDHASFNAVGVPGFFWGKTGSANYRFAWHTQNDRLNVAVPEYLVKNSTVSALVAYMLAEADTILPRPELPTETTTESESPDKKGDAEKNSADGKAKQPGEKPTEKPEPAAEGGKGDKTVN